MKILLDNKSILPKFEKTIVETMFNLKKKAMKNTIIIGLLLIFNVFATQNTTAQSLMKGLKNKVQQKVNERINQEAEDQINKEIDKQIGIEDEETRDSLKAERNQRRMNGMLKNLGIGGEPIPIAESYNFSQAIEMYLETYDASGKKISEGEFITLLNKDMKNMAYQATSGEMAEKSKGVFIVDAVNKATIILNEENGKKTGLVFGLDSLGNEGKAGADFSGVDDTPEFYAAHPNIKKTGRTKTISGYNCEEYIITDEGSKAEVWITRDLKLNTYDFFSTLFKVETAVTGIGWGYMMESTLTENTGEKSFMQVTKIHQNTDIGFTMSEYQITNMGNLNIPAGQ